jgi:hypothetical protein
MTKIQERPSTTLRNTDGGPLGGANRDPGAPTINVKNVDGVRNITLTLIEREDDTRSWDNFLVYFSHSTTMSCPPRGWRYILIGC